MIRAAIVGAGFGVLAVAALLWGYRSTEELALMVGVSVWIGLVTGLCVYLRRVALTVGR